jgi:outer membrane protein OmpA-like peptidoglycan-associated protein
VAANRILAHRRAEQVMRTLTKLGVDADRLFVVSRSTSVPIVDSVTPLITGNRRVTFENVFRGELRH